MKALRIAILMLAALGAFAADVFFGGVQPRSPEPVTVVAYTAYTLGYSETRKVPLWSVYTVSGPQGEPEPVARKGMPFFTEEATEARVTTRDYAGTGYSRGHMTPFAAIAYAFGAGAARETFSMANMVPQLQRHNGGIWSRLEEAVSGARTGGGFRPGLTGRSARIWVYTGPVLGGEAVISTKGIAVPMALWKAVIWITPGGATRACAWIIPHEEGLEAGAWMAYATTLAKVRERSGVDLAPGDASGLDARCDAGEVLP
ncbi:DNA/RNA non-specific endonuclease [Mesoterricola silvestris]|uniref:Nuclease n=1 Tax=Mesoterricola silvestris TaxID=2927979 RepID=A0AA48GMU8_9BACT|nr:DNA/RNA non-specific endonuclease [Mesoterricola silvestris]BDU74322.1 nuclease [Mesoterricola silvestris]